MKNPKPSFPPTAPGGVAVACGLMVWALAANRPWLRAEDNQSDFEIHLLFLWTPRTKQPMEWGFEWIPPRHGRGRRHRQVGFGHVPFAWFQARYGATRQASISTKRIGEFGPFTSTRWTALNLRKHQSDFNDSGA